MKELAITFYSQNYPAFNETGYYYQLIKGRPLTKINHKHDFFELFFVIKGHATHNCDEKIGVVNEYEFVILSPENTHYFETQSNDVYVFSLSITSEKFSKFASAFGFTPVYGKPYKAKNKNVIKEILRIPNALGNTQAILLNAVLSDLFSEIVRNNSVENSSVPHALQLAIDKFRKSENIGLGVEKLTALAGVSRMHLGRWIKKYYGKTPVAFIHDIRMQLATEYLEKTSFTVEYIAEILGLSSLSQFYAAFKKRFGCTPNAYRKQKYSALVTRL